ncbi:MAG: glycoside hydrolase family 88 protein, partial [Muribaculaceae bacterium]|nr:glycoside hydrolase family 88 protein [Muribaculaceae bacterium]
MKRLLTIAVGLMGAAIPAAAADWTAGPAAAAADQLAFQADEIKEPGQFPRALFTDYSIPLVAYHLEREPKDFYPQIELRNHPTLENFMTVRYGDYSDWTSGFFPGSLWLAYELTGRDDIKARAEKFTNQLLPVSFMTSTHDLGFMVNCSYGNALRLAPNDSIKEVITRTADNLISRFDPKVGCIRSWDFGPWNFPVIIDNMMNLQLLFNASRLTGDSKYRDIALTHADKTLKCHFRPDYSCYHVVSYTPDGEIETRCTFQGKADESAWARGQAWALYGYTECYRESNRPEYLDQARNVAAMIMKKNVTADLVPYWDLDARHAADSPRDASAGALYASALIELSTLVPEKEGKSYRKYAEKILKALASPAYAAPLGENGGFVLMHSVGSLPHGAEIDTPLSYA